MATNFPISLDTLTNPTPTSTLASPSHSAQHADANDAIEALEAKVGVNGSAVTTSLDYKVAQQGLVLVKSQTVGTAVSSVTVTDAFSSTFDNYRIVLNDIAASAQYNTLFSFPGYTSSGYFGSYYYDSCTGTDTGTARRNNGANLYLGTLGSTGDNSTSFDCFGPYRTDYTRIAGMENASGYSGWFAGSHFVQVSHTGFTIAPSGGTMTGGTIRVYGYNNG